MGIADDFYHHFMNKYKEINNSLKEHLEPAYRKKYNIRKLVSCFMSYQIVNLIFYLFIAEYLGQNNFSVAIAFFCALLYTYVGWKFWHYAYWSFKGGAIDSIANSIIYIGSIWSVFAKIFLQHFLLLIWIGFIEPFSGIKTWKKAVKHDKYLYIQNEKDEVWD